MRKHDIVEKAAKYIKGHRREHRRHYFLRGVSAIVVFCTVYSLILPAISMEQKTFCGLTEHKHSEACYKSELICGYTEDAAVEALSATETGETLSDITASGELQLEATAAGETQPETTGEETLPEATVPVEAHVHTDACYEQVLTCEKQEHTHALSCYADPNADVESADAWAHSVSGVALSGNWAEDVVAIAASQLGYRESEKNYQVAADGATIKGYTRYGDWSGDRYGDWNAMFVAFCLNYANVPESAFPRETNCSRWVRALTQRGLYHVSDYEPNQGDLVFFDKDGDGTSDHVGVITGTSKDENGHVTQLSTVEGDSSNCVQRGSHGIDESTISGFAALPENPDTSAQTIPAETTPVETAPKETVPTVEATKPETTAPTIAQAEHPVESVRPSAEIQAEGDPATELTLDTPMDVTVSAGETVRIPFTPTSTHEYVFQSTFTDYTDTCGYLYDASGKQLDYSDQDGDKNNFRITYTLTAGTLYYFGVRYYSSSNSGTIPVLLTLGTHQYTENEEGNLACGCGEVIREVSGLELNTQMDLVLPEKEIAKIPFTPTFTHEYVFQSTGGADIYGYLCDASGAQLTSNSGTNFGITYTLTAETTYYFHVKYNSSTMSGTIPILLTLGTHKFKDSGTGVLICDCGAEMASGLEVNKEVVVGVSAGQTVKIPFTPEVTHAYVFKASNSSGGYGYLYDASGKQLTSSSGTSFSVTYNLTAGEAYSFGVKYYSSSVTGTTSVLLTWGTHHYNENEAGELVCVCGIKAPLSGTCGEGVQWSYAGGVLTISGTGAMTDYSWSSRAPWNIFKEKIKSVVIEDGVTSIGNYAFCDCDSLTSVTIPGSVTSIGSSAFSNCSSLTSVTIPEGVTSIGSAAFSYCSSLTSVSIPDSVTSIGNSAFRDCRALTSVTIPDGVTSIGSETFDSCYSLTSVSIPDSVTSIGSYAFEHCSSLTSVNIPDGVTSIGGDAFSYCSSLTSVNIPDGVTSIGGDAFSYCSSLASVTIPDSVTSIGVSAFNSCSSLTSVSIPDSVTSIGRAAFSSCSSLTSVTLPESLTSIGEYAFSHCSSLTSATIPSSLTSIRGYVFDNCTSLTSVTISEGVTSIGNGMFYFCNSLTNVTIPDSVTSIGDCAFQACSSLSSVTIPKNVTSIGASAFSDCRSLTSVIIPGNVRRIGPAAFGRCYGLTSVTILDGVTSIGARAFYSCTALTSVTIPESMIVIEQDVFDDCENLETMYWNVKDPLLTFADCRYFAPFTVVIGESADVLTDDCFAKLLKMGCNNLEFERPNYITLPTLKADFTDAPLSMLPESRYYIDESGIFYRVSEAGQAYVAYYPAEAENTTIPASIPAEDGGEPIPVVGVDPYAFRQATISELTFAAPENITVLSNFAFYGAKNLASINGKSIAEEILNVLNPTEAGMQLFVDTKISAGGITDEPQRKENQDIELTIVTAPGTYHDPAKGEDGSFLYYTGEGAKTSITVSNPESGVADPGVVIRIYFNFSTKQGTLNYKPGHHDVKSNNFTYSLDVFETDIANCYCLELQRPEQGDTVSITFTSEYPSPTSGGGSATVWGGILTAEEKTALGTGLLPTDSFHRLGWDTRADDFPVSKTCDRGLTMRGDGKGGGLVDGLTYTISMSRAGSTLEYIGKDYMTSVDFEDTLMLPDGASLSEEVIAAIQDKTYTAEWVNNGYISWWGYCLPDKTEFMRLYSMGDPSLTINEQGQLVIRWTCRNGNLQTEISTVICKIEINKGVVVIPHPEEGKTYTITNHVTATQHYMYSEDRVKEASTSGGVSISEGELYLAKTTDYTKNSYYMGESVEFTIVAENLGVKPYNLLARLEDPLYSDLYLTAEQMAALFADDPEHDLTITISAATLCNIGEEKTVTGIDGTSQAVTDFSNTGEHTTHSGMSAKDPDRIGSVTITLAWGEADQLQITVNDETPVASAPTAEAIQEYLDSIGFLVTGNCQYKLVWDHTDEAGEPRVMIGGERIEKNFHVTIKDTFMRLNADGQWIDMGNNVASNSAYALDKAGMNLSEYNASCTAGYYYRDCWLYKNWSFDGQTIDAETELEQGSVLDYVLTASHRGTDSRDVVPLVDHMSGAQALLAPKELNKDMDWAAGCRTVTVGNVEYYFLSEPQTYTHVWTSETQMADSVTVTQSVSGLDTVIKWYFTNYSGDRTDTVPYKAMVCPNDAVPGAVAYSVGNETWLNDHESHRLYATIPGWYGINFSFNKEIVSGVGDTGAGRSNSLLHEGDKVVYRLTLNSNTDKDGNFLPLMLTGENMYDVVPGSIADHRWSKDNIQIDYGEECTVVNGDHWQVTDPTSDSQQIHWDADFSVTFTGEAHIYVTLTYPKEANWQSYVARYGGETLKNTFVAFNNRVSVYHDLALSGAARLQKGVYASGTYSSGGYGNEGRYYTTDINQKYDRLHYENRGSYAYAVQYYVTLENSGSGKLYLTELWDRLPRGFTFLGFGKSYYDARSALPATVYNADGQRMQRLMFTCTYTTKTEADGTQLVCFRFSGKSGNNPSVHYDESRGMYYLSPGEYIALEYACSTNYEQYTDDMARNTVSMPYYDYSGLGVTIDTGSRTDVVYAEEYTPNDGGCDLETNGQALNHGFTGGTSATQWLTSDVTVTRGEIKPGITKALTSATDTNGKVTKNPVSVNSQDLLSWTITVENDSTSRISDYVLTDVMQAPYMFTGVVKYEILRSIYNFSFTIQETEDRDKLKISYYFYSPYSETEILTIGGEPIVLRYGTDYNTRNRHIWLSISRDAAGNAVMSIRIPNDLFAIPGGGSGKLTLYTKNTTTEVTNMQYLNTCYITPLAQTWDNTTNKGNMTELKTPFSAEALPSVRNSAPVTTSYGYTTSSIKRVTEVGNASNTATSTSSPNYIVLDSAKNLFTYTASVDNSTPNAMDKLIMIDSLPEVGDHTVFLENDPRFSAFKVSLADDPHFAVTVTDEAGTTTTLDPASYKVEFSTKTTFDAGDWNGSSTWDSSQSEARSIRLVILDDAGTLIPSKSTVSLHFTCKVDGEANPGTIAWNSFGYHYSLMGEAAELEAAPLKVGVKLPGVPKLKKQIVDYAGYEVPAEQDKAFSFLLYEGTALTETYDTEAALTQALETAGRAYKKYELTVPAGQSCSEAVFLRTTGWDWTDSHEWVNGQTYTLVELPTEEEYAFGRFDTATNPSYSFVYNKAEDKVITCENTDLRWDVELTKVNTKGEALADAVFALYSPAQADKIAIPSEYSSLNVETEITRDGRKWYLKAINTTPADGKLSWEDLIREQYYLLEVKAPDGYNQPTGDGWLLECKNVERNVCKITVTNTSSHELPMTGGSGTTEYTAGGALLMACAGMLLLYSKKKRKKEDSASS